MRRVVNQNVQKRKFTVVLFLESKFDVGMLRVDEIKERQRKIFSVLLRSAIKLALSELSLTELIKSTTLLPVFKTT